ncbi:MAG: hypothetical protein NDJ89_10450 [Oligoflexia bacterium]|nr:hypothetical protein [Oligoflexia bacterium]
MKMLTLVAIGILTAFSAGAEEVRPPNNNKELKCVFHGGADQNGGVRCHLRVQLCEKSGMANEDFCKNDRDRRDEAFELRCNNGFDLESRDFAISHDQNNLWINADERGAFATLRVSEGGDAHLFVTNSRTFHMEGRCRHDDGHDRRD